MLNTFSIILLGLVSLNSSTLNAFDFLKIINGEPLPPGAFPFMVSLGFLRIKNYAHTCGGTIVSRYHILTAAHCVRDLGNSYNYTEYFEKKQQVLVAIAGTNNITGYSFFSLFNRDNVYLIKKISYNTAFTQITSPEDIAVLRVDKEFIFSLKISKIRLASTRDLSVIFGQKAIITGWGYTEEGRISNWLMYSTVSVLNGQNNPECGGFDNTQYCIKDLTKRNSNVCYGDSGSPLLRFEKYEWVQYGIASFVFVDSNKSCLNELPSFYTMIPLLKRWTIQQIQSI
ncbi:unnamed protein product [Brachionus calyciflorus]|uniref:Peptidase S1 domain-containing protein n=1 Tax=Brachionus calyciflorus TaxID=104777 RepID=A0A814PBZ9_9BILA|nr:unnamed protein product [Brachionus calyciflorus]